MNALMRGLERVEADLVLLSHTHDTYAKKVPRDEVTKSGPASIVRRVRVVARTGCLRRHEDGLPNTLQPHTPDYGTVRAYAPKADGWVEITYQLARNRCWVRY